MDTLCVPISMSVRLRGLYSVVVWLSGNALVSINEVNLRRARLVLGWVTMYGVQHPVRENIFLSAYNQPPRSTQPGHPSVVMRNEYTSDG